MLDSKLRSRTWAQSWRAGAEFERSQVIPAMIERIRVFLRNLWDSFGRFPDPNGLSLRPPKSQRLKSGTYRFDWTRRAMVAFLVLLSAAGCGRDGRPVRVVWEASGVQVTRLDLPLGGDGNAFVVSEYLLEGQEVSGRGVRQFRDRMVLTTRFTGRESPFHGYVVQGYINRTYGNGVVRAVRLQGRMELLAGHPEEALVIGGVYPVGSGGGTDNRLVSTVSFQIRLDPASGRILAKGV